LGSKAEAKKEVTKKAPKKTSPASK
jgi:hypothetical protein